MLGALGTSTGPAGVRALAGALRDPSATVRGAAADALSEVGATARVAWPALDTALASPWDVVPYGGGALFANAGTHQLGAFDPAAGFDATDPSEYPGWGPFDAFMSDAQARGFKVMFALAPPAPGWATRGTRRDRVGVNRPSAREFGRFAEAAARRFPGVDVWTIWNEPNHPGFLYPQSTKGGRPVAPHLYRAMVRAAVKGLKRGGVLNVVQHELELNCDAASIPEEIHIDLTGLEIGDSIHISNVNLPNGVTPSIDDRDFTVATIVAPSVMKDEADDAAAAEAEGDEGEEGAEGEDGAEAAEGGDAE